MEFFDLRTRIITCDGKHSYQLYNAVNKLVIWSAPDWWTTTDEAQTMCAAMKERVLGQMRSYGLVVAKDIEGRDIIMIPEQGDTAIMMVLAIHRDTGKFGFAVMSNTGKIIIRPKEYYDTPAEALHAAKHAHKEMLQAIESNGLGKITFPEPTADDFQPPDKNTAIASINQQGESSVVQEMDISEIARQMPHFGFRGFDRSVN